MVKFCSSGEFLLMLFFSFGAGSLLSPYLLACPRVGYRFFGTYPDFLFSQPYFPNWFESLIKIHLFLFCAFCRFLAASCGLLRQKLLRSPALPHKSITLFSEKLRRAYFKKDKPQAVYPVIFLSMAGIFSENMLKKGLNQGIFLKQHEKKRLI